MLESFAAIGFHYGWAQTLRSALLKRAVLLILAFSPFLYGQTGLGSLKGFVYDEDGRVIVGAKVKVSSPSLIGELMATTGSLGYFRIVNLPPGRYSVLLECENYRQQELQGVNIRAGKATSLNMVLQVGEFSKKIVITHEKQILDLTDPVRTLNIDGDFVNRLPISSSRDWDMIWSLIPGVVNEGDYGIFGARVEVHGGSIFQNVWRLDGINIGSTFTNANNVKFSPEIIQDASIVTAGFDASISAGSGGYINVVTKSGGNELNGSAVMIYQPTDWNWSNIEGGEPRELRIQQPEFSLGGPIKKDKTWFFTNYRYEHRTEGIARTPEDIALIESFDLPRPEQKLQSRNHRFFAKVTHALTPGHRIYGFVNYDKGIFRNSDQSSRGTDNTGIDIHGGGPLVVLRYEAAWNDNFNTTVSAGYRSNNSDTEANGGKNPSIVRYSDTTVSGGLIHGTGDFAYFNNRSGFAWWSDSTNERFQMRADATYYVENFFGSHDIGFGILAQPLEVADSDTNYGNPVYVHETRDANGNWIPFHQLVFTDSRTPAWRFGTEIYAGYLQDSWLASDQLSINAGIRVENQRDGVLLSITGFSPHIGASYALDKEGTSSIRLSYGIRQHLLAGRSGFSEIINAQSEQKLFYDNNLDGIWDVIRVVPAVPAQKTSAASVRHFNGAPVEIDPDISQPFFHELHLGYSRILPYNLKFDSTYVFRRNKNQHVNVNTNIIWDGDEFAGYKDPEFDAIFLFTNDKWSWSDYNSLEFTLTKEFSDGWQLVGSYTKQFHTINGTWRPDQVLGHMHPDSWFRWTNRESASGILKLASVFTLPYDVMVTTNFLWQSGRSTFPLFKNFGAGITVPETFTLSNGRVITHPFHTVRPLFQPRSVKRENLESISVSNIGIGKDFELGKYRVQTQFQVFNVFNEDTFTAVSIFNSEVDEEGNPTRKPRFFNPQGPRVAQFIVKLLF